MHGPTGLDYNALYRRMERMHLDDDRFDDLEYEVRVLEDSALETMREARA